MTVPPGTFHSSPVVKRMPRGGIDLPPMWDGGDFIARQPLASLVTRSPTTRVYPKYTIAVQRRVPDRAGNPRRCVERGSHKPSTPPRPSLTGAYRRRPPDDLSFMCAVIACVPQRTEFVGKASQSVRKPAVACPQRRRAARRPRPTSQSEVVIQALHEYFHSYNQYEIDRACEEINQADYEDSDLAGNDGKKFTRRYVRA